MFCPKLTDLHAFESFLFQFHERGLWMMHAYRSRCIVHHWGGLRRQGNVEERRNPNPNRNPNRNSNRNPNPKANHLQQHARSHHLCLQKIGSEFTHSDLTRN